MSETSDKNISVESENNPEKTSDTARDYGGKLCESDDCKICECRESCESGEVCKGDGGEICENNLYSYETNDYAEELKKTGAIAFVPSGVSMWPTLKNRGQTVIVTAKKERLKRYDVALFVRRDGKYVLHRVMEPKEGFYIICGDSQFVTENVKEEQVIGVMEGFYRGKRYISCSDEDYKKEVEEWFAKKTRRKIKLKVFYFFRGVRGKLGAAARKLGLRKKKEKV